MCLCRWVIRFVFTYSKQSKDFEYAKLYQMFSGLSVFQLHAFLLYCSAITIQRSSTHLVMIPCEKILCKEGKVKTFCMINGLVCLKSLPSVFLHFIFFTSLFNHSGVDTFTLLYLADIHFLYNVQICSALQGNLHCCREMSQTQCGGLVSKHLSQRKFTKCFSRIEMVRNDRPCNHT